MSGGGGGGGNQNITSTVTQKTDPPEYVKPYATSLLAGGSQIANQPYQPYPGMQVAPLSPEHQAAMYMGGQRAAQGSPVQTAANNQLQWTAMGGGMDNPWLTDAITLAQKEMMPQFGYMQRESGSFGNTGLNEAITGQLGDVATQMRFANYDQERNRQLQAAQLAPQAAAADYQDVQMMAGIGDMKRAYQQELIDNAVGQWDASMNWPYSQYDWFANLMRGAGWGTYGTGSSTTTQPNPNASSGLANLIGGGLAGAGLLSGLF